MRTFTVLLIRDHDEPGYTVLVPELPGCQTEGETVEEALEMARDAITGHIEAMAMHDEDIPEEPAEVIIASVEIEAAPASTSPAVAIQRSSGLKQASFTRAV